MAANHTPESELVEQIAKLDVEIARLTAERDRAKTDDARQVIQKQIDELAMRVRQLREKLPR
jgi:septal ring factor EnvC (AmiA/AmiB activator)